jgi:phage baseplate assembly protein gpV
VKRYGRIATSLVGGLALTAGAALAQVPPQTAKPARPSQMQPAAQSKPAGATEQTLTGEVVKFDAAAKTLTVKTAKGEEVVLVGTSTMINEGPKKLSAADLGSVAGYQAKIRYRNDGGRMVAHSVMVSKGAAK